MICLLEVLGRIRFRNYSRLPLWEGKLILAANHPGWLDVVILPLLYFPWWFRELLDRTRQLLALPARVIRRKTVSSPLSEDLKSIPASAADKHNFRYFWWIMEGWNISVNRRDEEIGGRGGVLKKAVEILDGNGRVIIYPAGGRDFKARANSDGIYDIHTRELIMRKPKIGMGWIVKQTGATIVPVRLEGTDLVLPNAPNKKLPRPLQFERYFFRVWHPITVKIGEPLRFTPGTNEEEVLQKYMQAQLALYHEDRNGRNGKNGHIDKVNLN